MIAQSTIDAVMAKIDIVDVIKEFIVLKKRGANYVGLSPFSNERTPSFTVSPAKGIFKCFSSGEAGNAIKFLMKHENQSYPESIRWLAGRYKVEFVEEITPEQADERLQHEAIYICNDFANKLFQHNLSDSVQAWDYLKGRQLSKEIVTEFEIGFAVPDNNYLTRLALKRSYKIESLIAADLSQQYSSGYQDKFKNRIIFPVHTISGRIAGFMGRVFNGEKDISKYINTADNSVFKKGSLLYGIHLAKHYIKKGEGAYLVEGQMDVVSMHSAGVRNTVASSGTALTIDHIRIIKRFTDRLTFLYDGDAAGFKAAARGIEIAIEEGMHVRVVVFPAGEDPDSFICNYGAEAFTEYVVANKKDIVDFFFRDIDKLSAEENDASKRHLLTIISKIDKQETFRIKEYVDKLALKYQIDPTGIYKFINGVRGNKAIELPKTVKQESINKFIAYELEFCRLLIKYGNQHYYGEYCRYWHFFNCMGGLENIRDQLALKIISIYDDFLSQKQIIPSLDDFLKVPDPEVSAFVTNIAFNQYEISQNWEGFDYITSPDEAKEINYGLANFLMNRYNSEIKENILLLKTETDMLVITELLEKNKKLQSLRQVESEKLGISILM